MLPDYKDITSRLGQPLWYDRHGVPRYDPFHPDMCDVYANYVAYMEIRCQACGKCFKVAVDRSKYDWLERQVEFPSSDSEGDFYYGDPPIHGDGCAGNTMSCETLRILEFWVRDGSTGYDWERKTEFEFDYRDLC